MIPTVQSVWKPPSELRNPPDALVSTNPPTTSKHRQARNALAYTRVVSNPSDSASTQIESTKTNQGNTGKRKNSVLWSKDAYSPLDHDISWFVLADERMVVVPFSPRYYCKDLLDEEHELIVIELQSAKDAGRQAWLEDEKLSAVAVRTLTGAYIVSRADLRSFVKRMVPLHKPIRNLSKALYKICTPHGAEGPAVTLLPVAEVLRKMPNSPCDEWLVNVS